MLIDSGLQSTLNTSFYNLQLLRGRMKCSDRKSRDPSPSSTNEGTPLWQGLRFACLTGPRSGAVPTPPAPPPRPRRRQSRVKFGPWRLAPRSEAARASLGSSPPEPRRLAGLRGHSGAGSLGHSLCYHVGEKFPTLRWGLPRCAPQRSRGPHFGTRSLSYRLQSQPSSWGTPPAAPPSPGPVTLL